MTEIVNILAQKLFLPKNYSLFLVKTF